MPPPPVTDRPAPPTPCPACGAPRDAAAGSAACAHCGARPPAGAAGEGEISPADRRRAVRAFNALGLAGAAAFAVPGLLVAAGVWFALSEFKAPAAVRWAVPAGVAAFFLIPLALSAVTGRVLSGLAAGGGEE